MKKFTDILLWTALVLAVLFFAYQRGYILAPFPSVSAKEAYNMIKNDSNVTVLDVRTKEEYEKDGHIAKATLIPVQVLSNNLNKLPKDKKIIVYCRSGHRSVKASRILEENGFHPININGGIKEWKRNNLPVE